MSTKYDADVTDKELLLPDLEVLRLRTEIAELRVKLADAQRILAENDLLDEMPKQIAQEERIALQQIDILAQLSDKGMPFANEDVKNFEVLVKTLLAIRGRSMPEEKEKKKKGTAPKVAELINIVRNNPKQNG